MKLLNDFPKSDDGFLSVFPLRLASFPRLLPGTASSLRRPAGKWGNTCSGITSAAVLAWAGVKTLPFKSPSDETVHQPESRLLRNVSHALSRQHRRCRLSKALFKWPHLPRWWVWGCFVFFGKHKGSWKRHARGQDVKADINRPNTHSIRITWESFDFQGGNEKCRRQDVTFDRRRHAKGVKGVKEQLTGHSEGTSTTRPQVSFRKKSNTQRQQTQPTLCNDGGVVGKPL